jgi:hypothetical protein
VDLGQETLAIFLFLTFPLFLENFSPLLSFSSALRKYPLKKIACYIKAIFI